MDMNNLSEDLQEAIEEYRLYKKIPSKKVLEKLHWEFKLSQVEMAKIFGVSNVTIHRWFKNYGIKARDRIEAAILASTKWPKKPFQGNLEEAAYYIGFRIGDLAVRKYGRRIEVTLCTTSPWMIELMHKLFDPYGKVYQFPYKRRKHEIVFGSHRYYWRLCIYLHDSFSFLLEKDVPQWIFENENCFYAFLAGFADAEGSIVITRSNKRGRKRSNIYRRLIIVNSRKQLLERIRNKLAQLGYFGSISTNKHGRTPELRVRRKLEVIKLISRLPFRHQKMIRWRKLLLETKDALYWDEVEDRIRMLRNRLRRETKECVKEATEEWLRHTKTSA
jgi:DNA-binding XRE family transcriptional regulator